MLTLYKPNYHSLIKYEDQDVGDYLYKKFKNKTVYEHIKEILEPFIDRYLKFINLRMR